ncbi:hypothetical protein CEUSTIGMA_g10077.t1 [Chlamydomonas eustigma]|uniref:Carboxypeptidase n=1 Tax=Chlamydomonas eustigma TaxID=1157962 RepID=A0A250XHV0_9CHLO|nr:hypothetical protein CEUSTIGMA_g10077.t1 [Chlamydomonas eustigma]|eukprot:GAX82651.1 hypothetical protein CEUSTIGMA_g10077.t1 [Chlamydomonas eustigma]
MIFIAVSHKIMYKVLFLLIAYAVSCSCANVVRDGRRIEEKEIIFPQVNLQGNPPIVDPPKRSAGYFKLNRTVDAHMFYFLFQSRNQIDTDPVVLWMTGGPGCSSELAVFYENGPYSINADMTLTETKYGWDRFHTTIFIDQPINTGFSYSEADEDRVFNEAGVAEDMLDFLQEFFVVHPELSERPFFVTGESYAGHYVPAVSHRVWLANKQKEGTPINLKGIAIGNGLTNPEIQFPAYADFALENKLISQPMHDSIKFWAPLCTLSTRVCNSLGWGWVCSIGVQVCQMTEFVPIMAANPGINVYDITKKCEGTLCYDFTNADKFLNLPSTRQALGVGQREWEGCNYDVYGDMTGDWLMNLEVVLPEMLEDGIRVLIYAGELDLICNWLGNYRWVEAMKWKGQSDWQASPEVEWKVLGKHAGSIKSAGDLTFLKVAAAGHMVPMDQPYNALAMITAFTRGQPLQSMDSVLLAEPIKNDQLIYMEEELLQQMVEGVVPNKQQSLFTSALQYVQDVVDSLSASEATA